MNLVEYVETRRRRVDLVLDRLLPAVSGPAARVAKAMRYAVLGGGKRLRPILSMAACASCGGVEEYALEPSTALEMLHTYSLIHDDLPAMDDDDLRRGRPTLHRAYDEATAVLAGDALHTLAFEILGGLPRGSGFALRRADAVTVLARASGIAGMVGGQVADLEAESRPVDEEGLRWIHRHKTGALFAASAEIGAIHAGAGQDVRRAMALYGGRLGEAFQVADDILDRTSTAEVLGKTPGKDLQAGKATYPALFGMEASAARARALTVEAVGALSQLGLLSEPLEELARFAVNRSS